MHAGAPWGVVKLHDSMVMYMYLLLFGDTIGKLGIKFNVLKLYVLSSINI